MRERRAPSNPFVARVRGEFGEMPGLRFTCAQACRLWQLDSVACEAVLQVLVEEGFLARTGDGAFVATPPTDRAKAKGGPVAASG